MVAAPAGRDHGAMELPTFVLIGAVFIAAGTVKGVSGMGLPTLSMALLGFTMPPAAAAALMVVPSLLTNLAQSIGPHWRSLTGRLWPLWLGLAAVTVFSPLPDRGSSGSVAPLALGALLVVYGAWGLGKPALPDPGRHAFLAGATAGALSGVLTAATGVFVMPLVAYLQSMRLPRQEFIQAMGMSFTIATLALVVRLGRLPAADLSISVEAVAMATAAAFCGLWAGGSLRRHLQPAAFAQALYLVFVLLGLVMLWKAQ